MAHDQRRYALRSSPFLPAYGNILLVLSFFAGLNISPEEFFPTIPQSVLIGSGLEPYRLPSMPLGMKVGIPHFLVPQLGEPALDKNKTLFLFLHCIVLSLNLRQQRYVRNDTRDKPKLLGKGTHGIHAEFGVYVFSLWGQTTCTVQFWLLKPGSSFQACQFIAVQEFGFVREPGVVDGQSWSLHRTTPRCWKHLSCDLLKTLQLGRWSSEGIVLYSQVKLSSFCANLINCWGKQSFDVTEGKYSN